MKEGKGSMQSVGEAMINKVRKGREGISIESNSLLGHVSLRAEDNYLIEDINVDEGKYRTIVTIFLTPKTMLKGKEGKEGLE